MNVVQAIVGQRVYSTLSTQYSCMARQYIVPTQMVYSSLIMSTGGRGESGPSLDQLPGHAASSSFFRPPSCFPTKHTSRATLSQFKQRVHFTQFPLYRVSSFLMCFLRRNWEKARIEFLMILDVEHIEKNWNFDFIYLCKTLNLKNKIYKQMGCYKKF